MSPPERPQFEYRYTVVLFVVAGMALMTAFVSNMLITIMEEEGTSRVVIAVYRSTQAVEGILFLFALIVAVLRTYHSRLAVPTTAAVSILLIFLVPIGTLAFIYWVGWVRKRERSDFSSAEGVASAPAMHQTGDKSARRPA